MQVVAAAGASVVVGQLTADRFAWAAGAVMVSVTASPSTVTFPALVTRRL